MKVSPMTAIRHTLVSLIDQFSDWPGDAEHPYRTSTARECL